MLAASVLGARHFRATNYEVGVAQIDES